ncbi:MAG: GNAT family N-acetyltransferase [Roseivirga sp.]|nr:GNAT family N-acetyltransferase [Roseivirga sp.]
MFATKYQRYEIELLLKAHEDFVKEIVYQAIYVSAGEPAPSRDILKSPDIRKYYQNWGRKGDYGLLLVHQPSEQPVGGCFVRYYSKDLAGYGFVSENIPELNIALLPDHRGNGQGTKLLGKLLCDLKQLNYQGVSLSVDKRNPVMSLYEKLGFRVVKEEGNPTMLLTFNS